MACCSSWNGSLRLLAGLSPKTWTPAPCRAVPPQLRGRLLTGREPRGAEPPSHARTLVGLVAAAAAQATRTDPCPCTVQHPQLNKPTRQSRPGRERPPSPSHLLSETLLQCLSGGPFPARLIPGLPALVLHDAAGTATLMRTQSCRVPPPPGIASPQRDHPHASRTDVEDSAPAAGTHQLDAGCSRSQGRYRAPAAQLCPIYRVSPFPCKACWERAQ